MIYFVMSTLQEIRILLDRQLFDEAISACTSVPINPKEKLERCRIVAEALTDANRLDDAARLLDMTEQITPHLSWAHRLRARIAAQRGSRIEQAYHLKLAFEHDPGDRTAATVYEQLLFESGEHELATRVHSEHVVHAENTLARLPKWTEQLSDSACSETDSARSLYLDLLEKAVCNWLYGDPRNQLGNLLPFNRSLREVGRDVPVLAHTMIGLVRLHHLRVMTERAIRQSIPGDFVETGVWRGGACILMAGVLRAFGATDRLVIAADSFEGLPPPDPRYAKDALTMFNFHLRAELAVGLAEVQTNFERYGLLGRNVKFLQGYFRDTLPTYPFGPIAVLRMDGDLYSSTMDSLMYLYDRVSPGGVIICDDYGIVIDARRAVLDFRMQRGITEPLIAVDGDAVYWRKAV